MPGSLGLSTPWAKAAITGPDREDVIEAIPDGWTLGVSMEANRSHWLLWTVDPDGAISKKFRVSASMSLTQACFFALRHWKLVGDTVVVMDRLGYVRSITDAE